MEKEHTSGTMDKIKGKANEIAGAVTGDTSRELKGKGQQVRGEGKNVLGDVKESFKDRE